MPTSNDVAETIKEELETLAALRDELRVQLSLAKADALDEWHRLEKSWQQIENEVKRVGAHSKGPAKEIGTAARDLIKELRDGYNRIRAQL
jgi:predicted  nucleic acid-binding Zn-ribbon protein